MLGLFDKAGKLAKGHMLGDGFNIAHHNITDLKRFHDVTLFARLQINAGS